MKKVGNYLHPFVELRKICLLTKIHARLELIRTELPSTAATSAATN